MSHPQRTIQAEAARRKKNETVIVTSVVAVVVLFLTFAGFFISQYVAKRNAEAAALALQLEEQAKEVARLQKQAEAEALYDAMRLGAQGAYIFDINDKRVLYEKNANEKMGIASITKTMTALTAYEIVEKERLVQINWSSLQTAGESGFYVGEQFLMKDLINFMMVSSSNDAASAIAQEIGAYVIRERGDTGLSPERTFVTEMNMLAEKIGMEHTTFKNPTGLDENNETLNGAIATAKDVALLFEYVLKKHPEILDATNKTSLRIASQGGYVHTIQNTNGIVATLPNLVGSKTGYTTQAGGNLAVIIDPGLNNPIIIVALGSTLDGRFADVKTMSDATLAYLAKITSFDLE